MTITLNITITIDPSGDDVTVSMAPPVTIRLPEVDSLATDEECAWAEFYGAWRDRYGNFRVKASELLGLFLEADTLAEMHPRLSCAESLGSAQVLFGRLIKNRVGVVAGGLKIEHAGARSGSLNYRIVEAD